MVTTGAMSSSLKAVSGGLRRLHQLLTVTDVGGRACRGLRTYATLCAMSTMNISLPDSLKEFVDSQVGSLGYSSSDEYLRELIRRDRDRQQLRGLLLEGAASPQSATADPSYFDGLRNRVHAASQQ